ncbi:MAG: DUF3047 domain-containing protein [Candidatus Schekmanbacteria bacterium]|nr:DUF3047 domain-containing protein [Candidatus Schekmanbacteria bacterium]
MFTIVTGNGRGPRAAGKDGIVIHGAFRGISFAALLASPVMALAQVVVELPAPGSPPWHEQPIPRVSRPSVYARQVFDRSAGVLATAECGASALGLRLGDVGLRQQLILEWEWRVDVAPNAEQERAKSGDDFAARVFVVFDSDRYVDPADRMRRWFIHQVTGESPPSHAISYVWSSRSEAGATWPNPFVASTRMVSLGSSALGAWVTRQVDVYADHARLFGAAPDAPPVGLAIMTDADNTCSRAVAAYRLFRFRDRLTSS